MRSTEIAVIGAGLIGLSIAYELKRRGASVRVFDRAQPGRGASWAGAGMLAPFSESVDDERLCAFMGDSLERYPDFVRQLVADSGVDPHLRLDGILHVARNERLPSTDAGRYEFLNAAQTIALEPALRGSIAGGLLSRGEGQVDNRRLGRALRAACDSRGVDISDDCPVHAIESDTRRVLGLRTPDGFVAAPVVINATGAWSAQLRDVPVACEPRIFPVKGQMLSLEIPKGFMRHVIWSDDIYLVPRTDGRLLIGATVEHAGFDARCTAAGIAHLLSGALAVAPSLRDFTVSETWAGLRPGTPDGRPYLGETPLEGYYLATGHYRNGILLAPATAVLLADLIENKSNDFARAFRIDRHDAEMLSR